MIHLAFELTPEGLDEAQVELDQIRSLVEKRAPEAGDRTAGAIVYRGCTGRSRDLLENLPVGKEAAVTFEELIATDPKLWVSNAGEPLGKSSLRAVLRNVKRVEKRLLRSGEIDRSVILADSSNYDADRGNRYYVGLDDRAAIDEIVAREK